METKTINLRDLPEELVRQAKAYAALSGMTLKDFVIQALTAAIKHEIQAVPRKATLMVTGKKGKRSKKN